MAVSLRMPVGSPVAGSMTISPPGGTGVARVTPASFRAALLARIMWPSRRLTQTGLSGVTASIQSRRGSSTGSNCWWSQSPFRIQRPGPSSRALAAMRAAKSSRLFASRRAMLFRAKPPARKWVWLSMKPGRTSAPPRSTSFVPSPTSLRTSAVVPAAKIFSPRTATASAHGRAASPVQTFPLTSARSTMLPSGRL